MGIRVLLVDDEKEFVDALAQRLEIRGFEVRTAYSGLEALRIIPDSSFEVVVLDIRMPGMEGLEVLEKIKGINPSIEVVMLTAHGSLAEAMNAMKKDAHDFIMKPASIDTIIEKINTAYEAGAISGRKTRSRK